MSRFAFKIAALVVVTVVAAVAATAWLTLRETTRQVEKSVDIAWQELDDVAQEIRVHGLLRGSWDDLGSVLPGLAQRLGQRVRVVLTDGTVLADTQPGTSPRQSVAVQTLPENTYVTELEATKALISYEVELALGRCLQAQGLRMRILARNDGMPGFYTDDPVPKPCLPVLGFAESSVAMKCAVDKGCVQREFAARLAALMPPPVLVQAGALDQPQQAKVSLLPILLSAGLVALLALVVSLLISRGALRPISALAASARRLGSGDLSGRVPENGDLVELTRAFNAMADSLQRSREQQHNMIADIAHELRTPLANIRGYIEAVRDGVLPADDELYRSLHEEALLQQRLIDDLQDLALAESGSLVYHMSTVDLADLLSTYRAAGVVVDAPEPVVVHADHDRLRQVVGNLVTNAQRAGAFSVTLRCRADGQSAVVEVADNGWGIAAGHLPHVFDRFWRADNARGRETGGRGLGLAIAREIITAHRGRISVASTLGVGTTFTVRLPLQGTPIA
ncbi:sensor histidine kinase [Lentzea sp. NPDC058450]|uniref:sensor histidine kinase n=1 Tax=Lentzea sp. NPDC058450 TaxID=3346505 RepID=UPI00364CF113